MVLKGLTNDSYFDALFMCGCNNFNIVTLHLFKGRSVSQMHLVKTLSSANFIEHKGYEPLPRWLFLCTTHLPNFYPVNMLDSSNYHAFTTVGFTEAS